MKSSSPTSCQKVSLGSEGSATSHVEVVKQLIGKASFFKEIAVVVSLELWRSTAYLLQGKWFRYLHWCYGQNISPCKGTILQMGQPHSFSNSPPLHFHLLSLALSFPTLILPFVATRW